MKKSLRFALAIFIVLIFLACDSTKTKYDFIVQTPEWGKMISYYDNKIMQSKIVVDYLNLCVSQQDIDKVINSGELDKEKTLFLKKYSSDYLKYLHSLF